MKNGQKGKIKIGKYKGAWNHLSTKREAIKSYALAREGQKLDQTFLFAIVRGKSDPLRNSQCWYYNEAFLLWIFRKVILKSS